MSLITTPPTPDRLAQKVARLLAAPNQIYTTLLSQWQQSVSAIWNDPSPQTILTALGTNGPTLIQNSADLVVFLESQVPGCTAATLAKIPPFTIVDGIVTITVPPSSNNSSVAKTVK